MSSLLYIVLLESQNIQQVLLINILATNIFNNFLKKGITKLDVCDHFLIFFSIQQTKEKLPKGVWKMKQRVFNNCTITSFKEQLSLLHWRHIEFNGTVSEISDTFLKTLTDIYNTNFPTREYILKNKDIKSSWISKGLYESWKQKKNYTSNFFRLRHLKMNLNTKPTKVYLKNTEKKLK